MKPPEENRITTSTQLGRTGSEPLACRRLLIQVGLQPRSRTRMRVACIEPDATAFSRIEQALAPLSRWSVERYSAGSEALSAFRRARPNVVLIDSDLPDIPGTECTNRLKQLAPELHIVVCSSRTGLIDVLHALASGASGYLVAPAADAEIVEAVRYGERGEPFLCKRAVAAMVNMLQAPASRRCSPPLSTREQDVMACLLVESSDKGIAERLNIAPETVHVHMKSLLKKMEVHDRSQAARRYWGLE